MRCAPVLALALLAFADTGSETSPALSRHLAAALAPKAAPPKKHAHTNVGLAVRNELRTFIASIPLTVSKALGGVEVLLQQVQSAGAAAYQKGTAAERRAANFARSVAAESVRVTHESVEKLHVLELSAKLVLKKLVHKTQLIEKASNAKLQAMSKLSQDAVADSSNMLKSMVGETKSMLQSGTQKVHDVIESAAAGAKATQAKLEQAANAAQAQLAKGKAELEELGREMQATVVAAKMNLAILHDDAQKEYYRMLDAVKMLQGAKQAHEHPESFLETLGSQGEAASATSASEMQRMIDEGAKVDLDELQKKVRAMNSDAVNELDSLAEDRKRSMSAAMSLLQTKDVNVGLGTLAKELQHLQDVAQAHSAKFHEESRKLASETRERIAIKKGEIEAGTWPETPSARPATHGGEIEAGEIEAGEIEAGTGPTSFLQTSDSDGLIISPSSFMESHSDMNLHDQAKALAKLNAHRMLSSVESSADVQSYNEQTHQAFQDLKAELHRNAQERKHDNARAASSLIQTSGQAPSFAETEALEQRDLAEMSAFTQRNRAEIAAMKEGHHSVRDTLRLAAESKAGEAVETAAANAEHTHPSSLLETEDQETDIKKANDDLSAITQQFKDGSFLQEPDDSLMESRSKAHTKQDELVAKYMGDFHAGFSAGLAKRRGEDATPEPLSFLEGENLREPSSKETALIQEGLRQLHGIQAEDFSMRGAQQKLEGVRKAGVERLGRLMSPKNMAPPLRAELKQDLLHDRAVQLRQSGL